MKDFYWEGNTFKIIGGYNIIGKGRLNNWSDHWQSNVVLSSLSISGKCNVIIRISLDEHFSLTASNQIISLYGDHLGTEMYISMNGNGYINGHGIMDKLIIEGTGIRYSVNVNLSDTISIVKEKLKEQEGFPVESQEIIFSGRCCNNEKTIQETAIKEEQSLHLVLKQ